LKETAATQGSQILHDNREEHCTKPTDKCSNIKAGRTENISPISSVQHNRRHVTYAEATVINCREHVTKLECGHGKWKLNDIYGKHRVQQQNAGSC
jgi:hypothetical protein